MLQWSVPCARSEFPLTLKKHYRRATRSRWLWQRQTHVNDWIMSVAERQNDSMQKFTKRKASVPWERTWTWYASKLLRHRNARSTLRKKASKHLQWWHSTTVPLTQSHASYCLNTPPHPHGILAAPWWHQTCLRPQATSEASKVF